MSANPKRAVTRLQKELKTIRELQTKGEDTGWSAGPVDETNLFKWEGFLFGPDKSPFEGGLFKIRIEFTADYPIKPPKVVFLTVPYHPNVYDNGNICLDILKEQWTPALQIDQLLQSIRSLLTDPNPNSPANPDAAAMYSRNRSGYDAKVRSMIAAANGDAVGGGGGGGASNSSSSASTTFSRH